MTTGFQFVSEQLARVEEKIGEACRSVGRTRDSVTLIAVTKNVSLELIQAAYELGIRDFGESRLQEALPKIELLPKDVRWHFIGPLQSNKAKAIAQRFSAIHSVCKVKQLHEIVKAGREIDVLLEINVAGEVQKAGLVLSNNRSETEQALDEWVRDVANCEQVHLRGLMTIGPDLEDPEALRPFFRKLSEWNESIGGQWLSMGMSGDFDVAIQEGATHIRVGSALFRG